MSRFAKVLLLLALVALPLRGMAAVVAELCAPQAHHAAGAQHECCAEDGTHAAAHGDPESGDTSCSHCASCSIGAPVASDAQSGLIPAPDGAAAIPFRHRRVQAYVPGRLDRPPLSL